MDKKASFGFIAEKLGMVFTAPVVILLAWEALSYFRVINAVYFPAPCVILRRFVHLLLQDPAFTQNVLFSLKRLALGALIAVPLALVLGLAVGLSRGFSRFFMPLISLTYPLPKLSILPLLMILLGIGDVSKIAIIAIGIFYFVLLGIIHGIRGLPRVYDDLAQVYRIPLSKKISSIVLIGILPDILHGCKLGIAYGLVMVVAGEFIAARNGIGFFMWNAWDQFRIIDVYVGLVVFSLLGLAVFAFFDGILLRMKWRGKERPW